VGIYTGGLPGRFAALNAGLDWSLWRVKVRNLLSKVQALEVGSGEASVLNEPRPLDLDLIAYGAKRNRPALTLPHPRAHLRRFVLEPLSEIAPDLVLPGQRHTVVELLASLPTGERCGG
jgi:2-amino-4-hydroxy-6-hydroxymethyldihydropteridine diphosphokinase